MAESLFAALDPEAQLWFQRLALRVPGADREKLEKLVAAVYADATRKAVQGVLDLMQTAGTLNADPDAIYPHANGYSCWFHAGGLGTAPLSAQEILARIEARRAS